MKPYGVRVIEHPDVVDIQSMGSKSSVGKLPRKSGVFHSYTRSVFAKATTRRYWARKARLDNKLACKEES